MSPIPRGRQQGFAEGANVSGISVRDPRTIQNQWRKSATTDAQADAITAALTKIQNDLNRLRRRILPAIQQTEETFYPFKVYQPTNLIPYIGVLVPMFLAPTDPLYTNGAPIMAMVTDQNTPTDFTATPPTVSIADSWRFFCVRSGLVEYRYSYIAGGSTNPAGLLSNIPLDPNNWAIKYGTGAGITPISDVISGTDGIGLFESGTSFDSPIEGIPNVLIVGSIIPSTDPFSVSLWIQITPDSLTDNVTMSLYGAVNVFTGTSAAFTAGSGPYIIPLAEVYYSVNSGIQLEPYQFLFDHVNNRYPGGNGNFNIAQGCMMNFRGFIEGNEQPASGADAVISPSDLNQQLFYPGDIVIVKGYANGWPTNVEQQAIYIFTGQQPAFDINASLWISWDYSDNGITPLDQNPNWTQIFNIPVIAA